MRRSRLPVAVVVGAPLVMLLVGGAVGWFTRDEGGGGSGITISTVVGEPLPDSLDEAAPLRPLTDAPNPHVIDPASIIGLETTQARLAVPGGAALDLPLAAGGTATAVDPESREPIVAAPFPPAPLPATPVASDEMPGLGTPQSTLPPPDATATTTAVDDEPLFVDECMLKPDTCWGASGSVTEPLTSGDEFALDPLEVSIPVAGASGYASLCNTVEAGQLPDPFLVPSSRPTVAVLVNQPSTLALTGTWTDGSELAKTTMVTLAAHDAEWQRAWEQEHVQRTIVACVTLPLDDVRTHAGGGIAGLQANVLAISAAGRAEVTGQVTLNIPIDGEDPLFAERITLADRGQQRLDDGVLYPAMHVQYAFLTDGVIPPGVRLDPTSLHVYGAHAFVEGADCAGWAVNKQGLDRTRSGSFSVRTEQRTVIGRERTVTVVDGDVYLDPNLPAGWQGHFCVRLSIIDDAGAKLTTLALRGATVRGPRTPVYDVGVLLDDPEFPADWQLRASWTTVEGNALCPAATVSNGPVDGAVVTKGAACTTSARLAPDGIVVSIVAIDAEGQDRPVFTVRVPVNTASCNPDDPFAFVSDGCNQGFNQSYDMPLADAGDDESVRVVLRVARTAEPGGVWQDPSHAWRIGEMTSFAF